MSYAVVVPFVDDGIYARCAERLRLENVLAVDNTGRDGRNLGVMRSHNLGIDHMHDTYADWLIVLSSACRFGAPGGLDFVDALDAAHPEAVVVTALDVFGWHCIAFRREAIDAIGRWDENFHPYGFDDNDFAIRVHKAFPEGLWPKVPVDVNDRAVGMGHSVKSGACRLAGLMPGFGEAQLRYFERKWGARPGVPFAAFHDRPFADARHAVGYWPVSPLTWGAAWDERAPIER